MAEAAERLRATARTLATLIQSGEFESWIVEELAQEVQALLVTADRLDELKNKKEAA